MKKLIVICCLFSGLLATISCQNKHTKDAGEIKNTPQEVVYTCPMHPQIKKDAPGQCPICGMNLVKMEKASKEDEENHLHNSSLPEGHAPFFLSAARSQMIGVKLDTVLKKSLFLKITAAGRLAFDPDLYSAQGEYIEAFKQVEGVKNSTLLEVQQSAQRMLEAAKMRLKILGLADKQIAELEKIDAISDSSLLLSNKGQEAWVYADIYEMDLPHVHEGLSAEINAPFLRGTMLYGKVISVDRVINPATRTAKARILISKARGILRPESFVEVAISAPLGEQITIPFDAIMDTGNQAWAFIADGKGNYTPRLLEIKFRAGAEVAIASGVSEGELIVA
ncbi:MAG: hypothetical protein A2451_09445, partial [Bdellovibrionales bacterium RIFOXYC2_FULL_39_8]